MKVLCLNLLVVLAFASCVQADVSTIKNGSFEDDGCIRYVVDQLVWEDLEWKLIQGQEPNGWDVNSVVGGGASKFNGRVDYNDCVVVDSWKTDGDCALRMYSKGPVASYIPFFNAGDEITVWQEVCLTNVDKIRFDVKFFSMIPSVFPWTSEKRTAIVHIDDIVAWHSDGLEEGIYLDQQIVLDDVDGLDKSGLHILKLALRVNVDGEPDSAYHVQWDNVKSIPTYSIGDFDYDCYVDFFDLAELVEFWLAEIESSNKYNLYTADDIDPNGVINFSDFAVFAQSWRDICYY